MLLVDRDYYIFPGSDQWQLDGEGCGVKNFVNIALKCPVAD